MMTVWTGLEPRPTPGLHARLWSLRVEESLTASLIISMSSVGMNERRGGIRFRAGSAKRFGGALLIAAQVGLDGISLLGEVSDSWLTNWFGAGLGLENDSSTASRILWSSEKGLEAGWGVSKWFDMMMMMEMVGVVR